MGTQPAGGTGGSITLLLWGAEETPLSQAWSVSHGWGSCSVSW